MRILHAVTCSLLVLTTCLAGCGGTSGPQMYPISGEVTLDGVPLKEGAISFVPADGKGLAAGGKIVDGKYTAKSVPGAKRVEIRAPKVVGQREAYQGVA